MPTSFLSTYDRIPFRIHHPCKRILFALSEVPVGVLTRHVKKRLCNLTLCSFNCSGGNQQQAQVEERGGRRAGWRPATFVRSFGGGAPHSFDVWTTLLIQSSSISARLAIPPTSLSSRVLLLPFHVVLAPKEACSIKKKTACDTKIWVMDFLDFGFLESMILYGL